MRSVCRMSEDDYNEHLMHANFSGDNAAVVRVVGSGAAVRQVVASTPGAIGFVRAADVNDSVKVASVEGATAGNPDYKIKTGK